MGPHGGLRPVLFVSNPKGKPVPQQWVDRLMMMYVMLRVYLKIVQCRFLVEYSEQIVFFMPSR
jgi:hypothetical protein